MRTDKDERDALDSFEQAYCALIDCHMDFLKKKRGLQQEVVNNHVKFQSLMDDIQVRQDQLLNQNQSELQDFFGDLGIKEAKIDKNQYTQL